MTSFKELREQLTIDDIKRILGQFGVEPVEGMEEEGVSVTFPTCCHNLEGGSPKLVYYENTKLFNCYSGADDGCGGCFDIFTLLQKMMALRGKTISLREAISLCGVDGDIEYSKDAYEYNVSDEIRHLQEMNSIYTPDNKKAQFKIYNKDILRKFNFDYMGLMPWIQEGMTVEVLQKFNIKYDALNEAIVIPNFNYQGDLIGIRGRFFKEKDVAKGKYRPMFINGILHNHPTSKTFYGIYENKAAIERKHMAIIFEGEKSVLLYGSIYGCDNNIALATLGQNISKEHIQLMLKMGVRNVIIAYDADYDDYESRKKVELNYIEKAKQLSPYFNVSILIDYDSLLPYKSSPIDGGKEIFERLLKTRRII